MENTILFKALREFTTGLLNQLLVNLAGQNGQTWLDEFKKFLRQEPCWVAVAEAVKEVKTYLRRLCVVKLGATDGTGSYATAKQIFKAGLDFDFENWGIVFSGVAPETNIAVCELIEDGKFSKFLGNTPEELECRRMLGAQFLRFCWDYPSYLRQEGYATFAVLTKNDAPVVQDLSNVFVADVRVLAHDRLHARTRHFDHGHVWRAKYRPRVLSPQQ